MTRTELENERQQLIEKREEALRHMRSTERNGLIDLAALETVMALDERISSLFDTIQVGGE